MATKSTADIKRFVGFTASDGTAHETFNKAKAYTIELKTKEALAGFASVMVDVNVGVTETERGNAAVYVEDLPAFLLAHKADILAAFSQEVTMRSPRKPKAPKAAVPAAEKAVTASRIFPGGGLAIAAPPAAPTEEVVTVDDEDITFV